MPAPPRLTVVGSINVDLVVQAERLPRPGETLSGARFMRIPGGKGANQAVAAARLGATVSMVGAVGRVQVEVRAGRNHDDVLPVGIDRDQRHAGAAVRAFQ